MGVIIKDGQKWGGAIRNFLVGTLAQAQANPNTEFYIDTTENAVAEAKDIKYDNSTSGSSKVTMQAETDFLHTRGLVYKGGISASQNFNNFITSGYYTDGGAAAANRPTNFGHLMVLNSVPENTYVQQVVFGANTISTRISYDSGTTWSAWKYITLS